VREILLSLNILLDITVILMDKNYCRIKFFIIIKKEYVLSSFLAHISP
jgi:hypothetical protein